MKTLTLDLDTVPGQPDNALDVVDLGLLGRRNTATSPRSGSCDQIRPENRSGENGIEYFV
jgi:hypothetical protein